MSGASEQDRVIAWFVGDDTGLSSETIAAAMVGIVPARPSVPHDAGDLGRCVRLMALFPEWTQDRFLARMSAVSYGWRCLAEVWPELVALYERERRSESGRCPETYDLLRQTERHALETDPDVEILARDPDGTPWHWRSKRVHTMRSEAATLEPTP